MSRATVISARDVGKRYTLGQSKGGYTLLTEALGQRLARRASKAETQEFWALRDINFDVQQGETFGILGHNGAGKSTLLKILSRVTHPTTGEIKLDGRVGALLEVGTGFHPELTGRENVYLNGAILGMTRIEIQRKFDEIVEFSGVERFIDTPVKRYSSGMQLRLAFAVAAHLEPEILIVDEVLSVGDLAFQEKCMGRMEAVAEEGRTILFVSHNLTAVKSLCSRSMLLENGRTTFEGPTDEVVDEYIRGVRNRAGTNLSDRTDRTGDGRLRFTELSFETNGEPTDSPESGRDVTIVLRYEVTGGPVANLSFGILAFTRLNEMMLHLSTPVTGTIFRELPHHGEVRCHLPRCPLPAGQYLLHVWAEEADRTVDFVAHACEMTVVPGDYYGSGRELPETHRAVLVDHSWSLTDTDGGNHHEQVSLAGNVRVPGPPVDGA